MRCTVSVAEWGAGGGEGGGRRWRREEENGMVILVGGRRSQIRLGECRGKGGGAVVKCQGGGGLGFFC